MAAYKSADAATRPRNLYTRLIDRFRTALRAVGLGILTYISKDRAEPSKVLVDRSLRLALARSLIHLLPACISMFLVAFNLQGWFIGIELQGEEDKDELKMGVLQISAKLQELLIVASLGSVVIHVLRWELAFGAGLPFGLIVSGWKFTDISYFWSPEFLGAVFLPEVVPQQRQLWKRAGLVALVFVSGLIAVTAGPAAAVLMIPRRLEYPIGGSIFWLSGGEEQLWPTTLTADYYKERDCSPEQTLVDQSCPGYGYPSLFSHYSRWWNFQDEDFEFQVSDGHLRKVMYVYPARAYNRDTWVFTGHAATARMQDAMRSMHSKSIAYLEATKPWAAPWPRLLRNAEEQAYEVETKVPAVRTVCMMQLNATFTSTDFKLSFVDIPEADVVGWPIDFANQSYVRTPTREIDVYDTVRDALTRRGIWPRNSSRLDEGRVFANNQRRIIALPVSMEDSGMANSLGLVLFVNGTNTDPPFNMVTCSIDARWAGAKSIISSDFPSRRLLEHEFVEGRVRNSVEVELEKKTLGFLHSYGPAEPGIDLTGIRLDTSWYDLFSPVVAGGPVGRAGVEAAAAAGMPSGSSTNQTALERIIDASYGGDWYYMPQMQHTIATAVADGLSRSGMIPNREISHHLGAWPWGDWQVENEELARKMVRRGGPKPTHDIPEGLRTGNATRMVMQAKFTGLTMVANDWFDYFCIAVLLTHAAIALGHTIFVCWRRETSGAWDTILEFVALAHKSPAPAGSVLANTCAGVTSFKTIGAVAWVEVGEPGADNGDELRLRFRGDAEKRSEGREVETGKKYNQVEEKEGQEAEGEGDSDGLNPGESRP